MVAVPDSYVAPFIIWGRMNEVMGLGQKLGQKYRRTEQIRKIQLLET